MGRLRALFRVVCWLVVASAAQTAAADAPARSFALVITNNRSTDGAQPDLQYADDDGARYYQVFRAISESSEVVLHTRMDRASAALYPAAAAAAQPPTRSAVLKSRDRLAQAILAARSRGERTVLYLVYAGHGEMHDGRGFLHLEDGLIGGDFMEHELLEGLGADAAHVILDSCNSFFVINPRKPGGKRWATPKDMAFGFSARHPEVGLFLSTNSEGDVFEWSELESGVFSHEVRSGLRGAADVDHDGAITYLELAGFVEQANRSLLREAARPHLFYRGPAGDADAPLFSTQSMRGARLDLSTEQTRFWIKSDQGERLLDAHKEPGAMRLVLPDEPDTEYSLYVQSEGDDGRVVVREHVLELRADSDLLALQTATTPSQQARGKHRLFERLFGEPYGPEALAGYKKRAATEPAPVFGVTDDDVDRMHNYLKQFAEEGRSHRITGGVMSLGFGAVAGSAAIALLTRPDRAQHQNQIFLSSGLSAGLLGLGLAASLKLSHGELALESFEHTLLRGADDRARAFVDTDSWLGRIAKRQRRTRRFLMWAFEAAAASMAAAATLELFDEVHGSQARRERAVSLSLVYSGAAMFSAIGVVVGLRESPAERMIRLVREDPGLKLHLTPSLGPSAFGLSLGGSF